MQYYQEICLNGHQATDESSYVHCNEYCKKCGEKLISQCPNCNHGIEGYYEPEGIVVLRGAGDYVPVPNYCNYCGKPYPWTVRIMEASKDLIEISNLSDKDKEKLDKTIPDLLSETPKTKAAIIKFKLLSKKIGPTILSGLKDILIDVCAESAKKALWGI